MSTLIILQILNVFIYFCRCQISKGYCVTVVLILFITKGKQKHFAVAFVFKTAEYIIAGCQESFCTVKKVTFKDRKAFSTFTKVFHTSESFPKSRKFFHTSESFQNLRNFSKLKSVSQS